MTSNNEIRPKVIYESENDDEEFEEYYIDEEGYAYERSPNDQRSDVMNPNNPEQQADLDNRTNQMNPQHPAYRSSRRK